MTQPGGVISAQAGIHFLCSDTLTKAVKVDSRFRGNDPQELREVSR